ncbi:MAG: sensor histidine kinase [Candidatus Acidiferrales bacterium]
MDNPLPSRFTERLFVYLSRFCDVRYCIARHIGFLIGLGRTAGDPNVQPHSIEQVIALLKRPLERGEVLEKLISDCMSREPLDGMPADDTPEEAAIFALATHVFLQTAAANRCLKALGHLLGDAALEDLMVLLTFIRTAHYWTKVHPKLEMEEDIRKLLEMHEALAECVLRDPEVQSREVGERLLDELASLRQHAEGSERLRDMSSRMIQIQDEERRNLARELHDSTGQLLSVLNVNLSQLVTRLSTEDTEVSEAAAACRSLASEITSQIRTVSYLLHPPLLEEIGLDAALRWFAEGFAERSGIAVHVESSSSETPKLPQEIEITLFRIVQEALANIHRHSGSKSATIRLLRRERHLSLEIEDNGIGISKEILAKLRVCGSGVGITGMRERLRPFKGVLDIESNGAGTKITATLPLNSAPEPAMRKAEPA